MNRHRPDTGSNCRRSAPLRLNIRLSTEDLEWPWLSAGMGHIPNHPVRGDDPGKRGTAY